MKVCSIFTFTTQQSRVQREQTDIITSHEDKQGDDWWADGTKERGIK